MANHGKRGLLYIHTRKRREQEEPLVHLERWEPFTCDIICRECGLPCIERLNEVSLLTTYRCENKHKNYRIED